MYIIDGHPLCLDCYAKWAQVKDAAIAQSLTLVNYYDEMQEYLIGLRSQAPRLRPPQTIQATFNRGETNLSNITIDGSVIGMLNTGNIEDVKNIDVHVTALTQTGNEEVAMALRTLTEAVIANQEISKEQRSEFLDQLNLVSSQAAMQANDRKPGLIKPVLNGLARGLTAVASLAEVWAVAGDTICVFFGVENPFRR
ncbi:MAG: hypothetical protein ACXWID_13755 [Pyrinomonadaceae bacterium]